MAIAQKTLWDEVKELVLEQYKSSPNLKGLIQSVVEECAQPIDDAAFSIQDFFDISKASGGWLDILGKYVSLERNPGESDDPFRERIVIEASKNTAGTPDNAIYVAKMMSGDSNPQYMDEAPATFFVYTGPRTDGNGGIEQGGSQLTRSQVKGMAPAGVLGLPGAAINANAGSAGNESFLADYDGKIFLMAADDSAIS